jgi:hypothetical protein
VSYHLFLCDLATKLWPYCGQEVMKTSDYVND